ncbi:MAG: ABC transporter permease [Puniceicoccales bacterium]|jgi:lipoprotein-releasing system permease protein|nr:ABC transporter permease [Puniceicoccales bacterium]
MSWYVYFALKQLFPSRRWLSFFSFASIGGVAIGSAVLFIVLSVMNGFQFGIQKRITDFQGDVQIGDASLLPVSESLRQLLSTQPEIQSFMPYAHGVVLLQAGDRPIFPAIQGGDWAQCPAIHSYIQPSLPPSSPPLPEDDTVFLSPDLAEILGVSTGDRLELYSPLALAGLKKGFLLPPKNVRISGILKSPENGSLPLAILCSLKLMQELYGLGEAVHGYSLYLRPEVDAVAYAARLNSLLPEPYRATSWIENHRELLSALRLEKTMMFFVLLFILLMAAFSFSCALSFNIIRKTREIGLLQALGATPNEIALCFCFQGLLVGLLGSVGGFAIGRLVLEIRDSILSGLKFCLAGCSGLGPLSRYPHLPVRYEGGDILSIFLFANAICLLAGLIPAWRASKIAPAQALRAEN